MEGGGGDMWGGGGGGLKLRNDEYPLYILLLTKVFFYYRRKFWIDVHISTILIEFLRNSDCFFAVYLLHFLLGLLFEWRKKDKKIRNDLYL